MVMDATQQQATPQPSPQSVGREFVRQYYTLLNKAPNHLHRFYNNNSSFIHGDSTLVVGQKSIHNRIQQLNFRDCHAKISQVDSQATLGNAVVVQVTGELSNDGQPMRRFTQTFVLAAQSPKKYYVHNDIFRYQDVYMDEENETDSRSENGDEQECLTPSLSDQQLQPVAVSVAGGIGTEPLQAVPGQVIAGSVTGAAAILPQQQPQGVANAPLQQQAIYYSMPAAAGRPVQMLGAPQGAGVPLGAQYAAPAGTAGVPALQQMQPAGVAQLNGVGAHDEILPGSMPPQQPMVAPTTSPVLQAVATSVPIAAPVLNVQTPLSTVAPVAAGPQSGYQQQTLLPAPPQQQHQSVSTSTSMQNAPSHVEVADESNMNNGTSAPVVPPAFIPEPAGPIVEDFKTINEQQQQEKYEAAKQQQQQQNEPKTYANLFKSSSSSPSGFVNAAMQQQQQLQQQQQQQQQQQLQHQSTNSGYQSGVSTSSYAQSNNSNPMSGYNNRNSESSVRMDNSGSNNMGSGPQGGPMQQRSNGPKYSKDFDQRRPSNSFGDNQQLFLGNIPLAATEDDLKAIFGRFGTVVELRILVKPNKVPPGIRNPLNYGFITYDDQESVQNCLANCPLYYPENSPDSQKLNVEEKKPRMRNDMPPRQGMGNNMNNPQRNNMGGGPPPRSLANAGNGGGNMMRGGGNNGGNMSRGGAGGGPRIGGAFNRNGPPNGGGQQMRGGAHNNNNNSNNNTHSGGSGGYGNRR